MTGQTKFVKSCLLLKTPVWTVRSLTSAAYRTTTTSKIDQFFSTLFGALNGDVVDAAFLLKNSLSNVEWRYLVLVPEHVCSPATLLLDCYPLSANALAYV